MKVMNHKVTDLFTPELFMLLRLGQNENRHADRVIAARRQSRWVVERVREMSRPSIDDLMPFGTQRAGSSSKFAIGGEGGDDGAGFGVGGGIAECWGT
jgi:hypothetical protein